jgi:hypothetical protein
MLQLLLEQRKVGKYVLGQALRARHSFEQGLAEALLVPLLRDGPE